jgi:hypothetical protein
MARILLLGTWLAQPEPTREEINRRNGGALTFGGLAGQLEISGPRIEVDRRWIVNDRTWKHGMPRSVVDGVVERLDDEVFVVVDEPRGSEHGHGPGRDHRPAEPGRERGG